MKKLKSFLLMALCVIACAGYAQLKEVASIGKAITKEKATAWTQQFEKTNPNSIYGHYYGSKMLRELLSANDLAGVFIFNGQDESGKIHLVFRAADKNGEVLNNAGAYEDGLPCPPSCPNENIGSIGSKIDEGVASMLIENFQKNNAGKVFSHLYGKTVFETILNQATVEGIYFSNGLDEKGMEHMILSGVNKNGKQIGSSYNDGSICPPSCPEDPQAKAVTKEITSIGKAISKETANAWAQRFEKTNPNSIYGHYYGSKMLRELLSTNGLAGVFIFNGQDESGKIHLVFRAADKNGEVIDNAGAYEDGLPCPPHCPEENVGSIGSKIDEGVASMLIENFQKNNAGKVFSHLYGKTVFETILNQATVEGIYFSNGLDEKGMEHMILSGVNKNGKVVGGSYNDGALCPPVCPDVRTKSVTARN